MLEKAPRSSGDENDINYEELAQQFSGDMPPIQSEDGRYLILSDGSIVFAEAWEIQRPELN